MKKSIIIWAAAIILVAIAIYTTYQYNNSAPVPQTETPAGNPAQSSTSQEEILDAMDAVDFVLEDTNGNKVALSDFKGKTILLNFWASWCDPCKYEMPFIEELYNDRKDSDFVVLTVNLQESKSVVSEFMKENKYTFPVLLDDKGDIAYEYSVRGIPLSLLINKDFKIVSAHEGAMENYEMLKEFVDQLNEEK